MEQKKRCFMNRTFGEKLLVRNIDLPDGEINAFYQ